MVVVDARQIADGISEGVNALYRLVQVLRSPMSTQGGSLGLNGIQMSLDLYESSLAALLEIPPTIVTNIQPRSEHLHRIRALRQVLHALSEKKMGPGDVLPIAEECVAEALRFP